MVRKLHLHLTGFRPIVAGLLLRRFVEFGSGALKARGKVVLLGTENHVLVLIRRGGEELRLDETMKSSVFLPPFLCENPLYTSRLRANMSLNFQKVFVWNYERLVTSAALVPVRPIRTSVRYTYTISTKRKGASGKLKSYLPKSLLLSDTLLIIRIAN